MVSPGLGEEVLSEATYIGYFLRGSWGALESESGTLGMHCFSGSCDEVG